MNFQLTSADFVLVYPKSRSILKLWFCCISFVTLSKVPSSSVLKRRFCWFSTLHHLGDGLSIASVKGLHSCPIRFACWFPIRASTSAMPRPPDPPLFWVTSCCKARVEHLQSCSRLPSRRNHNNDTALLVPRPCHLLTIRWRLCTGDVFSSLLTAVPGLCRCA